MSSANSRAFDLPARLLETLGGLPRPSCYLVALSGGLDSVTLLHALHRIRRRLPAPLEAVHVHHGLHPQADHWARWCADRCEALGIPLSVVRVEVPRAPRRSLEEAARTARLAALESRLPPQGMLLLAHHADDQAETFLLQALRGAGVEGLAAMPLVRRLGQGWLVRPFLALERRALEAWARGEGLEWVEDPGNRDRRHARNFLRHEVLPLLRRRWPAAARTLGRSAGHCAEAAALVEEGAEEALAGHLDHGGWRLALAALEGATAARRRLLLRRWIRRQGLRAPSAAVLERILAGPAGPAAGGEVHWKGGAVRRHRERLYLFPRPLPPPPGHWQAVWDGRGVLELPAGYGRLEPLGAPPHRRLEVHFRTPGLACRPAGRQGTRSLKKLCQELGIPPWLRSRLPLVTAGGRLLALADYLLCDPAEGAPPWRWVRDPWLA